jgi:RecA-family ATPase
MRGAVTILKPGKVYVDKPKPQRQEDAATPPETEPGWEAEPWRAQLPAVIPKIRLTPFSQIAFDSLEPEWLVKKLVPRAGMGVVWGPPQTYKSFWLYDLSMHVALGWDYRDRLVQQGAVVYCAFEGGKGLSKRKAAFCKFHGIAAAKSVPFYLQDARLALAKHAQDLIEAIRADGISPALIVLDTLNRSMTGSESSDADMGAYLAAADLLRETFDCFVMIVHHSGWDASHVRGHTSLPAGVDLEIASLGRATWFASLRSRR